ncbi:hypothetical protein AB0C10_14035, partial [Microbispora amethystogenes]
MTEPTRAPHPQEALLPVPPAAGKRYTRLTERTRGSSERTGSGTERARAGARKGAREAAASLPVARIVVDTPLPHLDRPFDYLVPAAMDAEAVPGCRVRVRFAGQLADGYLLERLAESEHEGRLSFLERVISPEPVLTPEIARLARAVADRYAGTLPDVLRLAIPPRHARVEAEARTPVRRADLPADTGAAAPAEGDEAGRVTTSPASVREEDPAAGTADATPVRGDDVNRDDAARGDADRDAESAAPPRDDGVDRGDADRDAESAAPPRDDGVDRGDADRDAESAVLARDDGADREGARREHATGEHMRPAPQHGGRPTPVSAYTGPWEAYPAGVSFLEALAEGRAPRAVWTALPGTDDEGPAWPHAIAAAARATLDGGRGVVVVVPDGKDVALVAEALGDTPHVAITADLGPAERYRRWLKALRGEAGIAVGNRPAAFAPVARLGLAVIWDDGDDLHAERHAPYPHAREVLGLRAHQAGAGLLVGGYARTAEATALVETGWAGPLVPDRAAVRARAPHQAVEHEPAEAEVDLEPL